MNYTIENFIGIFPNVADKEYCELIISHFENISETLEPEPGGRIWTRQHEGAPQLEKNDVTCRLGLQEDDELLKGYDETINLESERLLLKRFNTIVWECYEKYAAEYGTLKYLGQHKVTPYVRIQKTALGQGYHIWHCDAGTIDTNRRIIAIILYLNTVEEGGETEFLYQHTRIQPEQGTLVLFPPYWTHPHRGNPPLKENKYIITNWIEYI